MSDENKEVEQTTSPEADQEEQKDNSSELGSGQSKSVEELEKEAEQAREALARAEHKIVQLKGEKKNVPQLDIDSIKSDILKSVEDKFEPKLKSIEQFDALKKENDELKAALVSERSTSESGSGESVRKEKEIKPNPTDKDIKIANQFGMSVEDYMKYKVKE